MLPWIQNRVQRTCFSHLACDIKHKYNHSGNECNTFSKAFWLGSQHSGRSHTTATDQCYGWIHQWMYSDLSVSVASQEVEEHHVSSRRTDAHTNQPAGSCRRCLWTAVMSITMFLFFWWYTLWAGNSLTISILTLSESPTSCQCLCRMATWHEVWNYVQKNCHTTHSIHLHPRYLSSHYSPQYTNAHRPFSGTVQSDVSLARLNSGEGCLVAPFWLHLVLYRPQMWVAQVHITRANVTRVLEVCWWTNHGPVDPPDLLPHTFPPLCCRLVNTAREPLYPHLPRHVARLIAGH